MRRMSEEPLRIIFEGDAVEARAGDTVASALLRAGVGTFSRGPKYHRPRGPFCLSGNCAQCHMRVDGEPNVPTCETPVHQGQVIERQNSLGSGDTDLLRAVDFFFPEKLDHHHLMTRFRSLSAATQAIARRLAGIGEKPERDLAPQATEQIDAQTVVIGGGGSGLAAARRFEGELLLIDGRTRLGGRANDGLAPMPDLTLPPRVSVLLETRAVGLFEEGGERLLLCRQPDRLVVVRAQRVVLATGGIERPLPFESNDLPGVFAGRGLVRLVRETGVIPGRNVIVVGSDPDNAIVAEALRKAGAQIAATVDGTALVPVRAMGRSKVTGLKVREQDGTERKISCDLIAVVSPLAPAYELGAEVGANARLDRAVGGFTLSVDEEGRTSVPWLYAAGRMAGR